jgi:hypothetical protein
MADRGNGHAGTCAVIYRGTVPGGGEGAIELFAAADAATLADAWSRLSARFGPVDPRTIEIEIREVDSATG